MGCPFEPKDVSKTVLLTLGATQNIRYGAHVPVLFVRYLVHGLVHRSSLPMFPKKSGDL